MDTLRELVDGFEPHDTIYSRDMTARHGDQPGSERAVGGGVPGVGELGGYREGAIPGNPASLAAALG